MKVGINIQSWTDVITNSSTTIFCTIESRFKTIITSIQDYLNSFLPYKVSFEPSYLDENKYVIWFNIEYGGDETEKFSVQMRALITQLIQEHFPNGGYIITNGEDYN